MGNLQFQNLQPYLFLLIGIAGILYSIFKKNKKIENPEQVEGIVFELSRQPYHSTNTATSFYDLVTVRFVTKKLEWITAEYKNDLASFYTGQYKVGDKIQIIYNSNNPNEFTILTKQSETRTRIILMVAAFVFFVIGIFQLLNLFK